MPPQRRTIESSETAEAYRNAAERQAVNEGTEKVPDMLTELQARRTEIDRTSTRLFVFSQCAEHGLQTVIDRFGAQQFAEAFAALHDGPQHKEDATLVDVIKILEPSREARAELYDEIGDAATTLEKQLETQTPDEQLESQNLDDQSFAASHGDVARMRATVSAFRTLDGVGSRIVGAKVTALLNKPSTHWLGLTMERLRHFGVQHEPHVFAELLQERGEGNLRVAAQEMQMDVRESNELLYHEIAVAQGELRVAYEAEVERMQTEANERLLRLGGDVVKLAQVSPDTAGIERAVDEVATRALDEMAVIENQLVDQLAQAEAQFRGLNAALTKQATSRWN